MSDGKPEVSGRIASPRRRDLGTVQMPPPLPRFEVVDTTRAELMAFVKEKARIAGGVLENSRDLVDLRLVLRQDGDHEALAAIDKILKAAKKRARRARRARDGK